MPIVLPSSYQNPIQRQADLTQTMIDLASVVTQINAGSSPILPVTLDAINTTASIPVPSTPTIFTLPTIQTIQNIAFDTATGILTVQKAGNYQVAVILNVIPVVATQVFYGLEVDTGSGTFVSVPTSGRQQGCNAAVNGQIYFVSNSYFIANLRARVYIWCSNGTTTFQTVTTTALPGGANQVAAARILITGV